MAINKTIHALRHDGSTPEVNFLDSWRENNPQVTIRKWSFALVLAMFQSDLEIITLFNSMRKLVHRIDFAKILILLKCGGVFLDYDIQVRLPLDRFFQRDYLFANGNGPGLHITCVNAVMGGQADAEVWKMIIENIKIFPLEKLNSEKNYSIGPNLLTACVTSAGLSDFIYPSATFFPSYAQRENAFTIHHHQAPPEWLGKICD